MVHQVVVWGAADVWTWSDNLVHYSNLGQLCNYDLEPYVNSEDVTVPSVLKSLNDTYFGYLGLLSSALSVATATTKH